ncbi:MAG: SO_0444 family Cu/Zn efflux transporter [Verrucomicrobiota bacterium JB022]|nr:SO_0444 family Cu/Zn efflux transporter [Verrucomicrobiota bacterium JB022]
MNWVSELLRGVWALVAEMAPYLWLGFGIAALLHAVVKESWVREHLGKRGFWQTVKATLLGVPLPLCSCGVIPVAAGIRRQGGSAGATAAFTASTPHTGVDSILATAGMISWPFALVRIGVAAVSGVVTGVMVDRFGQADDVAPKDIDAGCGCGCGCKGEEAACACEDEPEEAHSCCSSSKAKEAHTCCASQPVEAIAQPESSCCSSKTQPAVTSCCSHEAPVEEASCCSSHKAAESSCCSSHGAEHAHHAPSKLAEGLRFGFETLPRDLSRSLLLGFVLAGVLTQLLPSGALQDYIGSGWIEYVAATVIGLPLYVCAIGSIPIAVALLAAGLSPGAALIFLVVGPATSVATMVALRKIIGARSTVLYIASLTVTAWIAALLVDLGHWNVIGHVHPMEMQAAWWQHVLGAGLIALLVWPWLQRLLPKAKASAKEEAHACH